MHAALGFEQLANVVRMKLLADPPVQEVKPGRGDQSIVSVAEEGPPPSPLLLRPLLVEQHLRSSKVRLLPCEPRSEVGLEADECFLSRHLRSVLLFEGCHADPR